MERAFAAARARARRAVGGAARCRARRHAAAALLMAADRARAAAIPERRSQQQRRSLLCARASGADGAAVGQRDSCARRARPHQRHLGPGRLAAGAGLARWPRGAITHNPRMVTKKPKGLGLGLEALLGPKVSDAPASPPGA